MDLEMRISSEGENSMLNLEYSLKENKDVVEWRFKKHPSKGDPDSGEEHILRMALSEYIAGLKRLSKDRVCCIPVISAEGIQSPEYFVIENEFGLVNISYSETEDYEGVMVSKLRTAMTLNQIYPVKVETAPEARENYYGPPNMPYRF